MIFPRQVAVILNNDQADSTINPIVAKVTTKDVINKFIYDTCRSCAIWFLDSWFFTCEVAVIVNNDQADTTTNPIATKVTIKEVLNRFI